MRRCATARSSTVSMSNSTPGSSSSTAAVGIAREQPARALVALEHHQLGEQLGAEAHRMAAAAAVLGEGDGLLVERFGHGAQAARAAPAACRPGSTSQPVALACMDTPAAIESPMPQAVCERGRRRRPCRRRDQALRLAAQRLGDDEHDRHFGGDGVAQGAHEHGVAAQLFAELVTRSVVSAPCARRQHDDGRLIFHGALARRLPDAAAH